MADEVGKLPARLDAETLASLSSKRPRDYDWESTQNPETAYGLKLWMVMSNEKGEKEKTFLRNTVWYEEWAENRDYSTEPYLVKRRHT